MANKCKNFIEIEDLEIYDYEKTRENVYTLFKKYRRFNTKREIIEQRSISSLSFDNLGIYGNSMNDPVGNKVEQSIKYTDFVDTINSIYKMYEYQLSEDEKCIYKNLLANKTTDDELMEKLHLNSKSGLYNRKKSCIIKVAQWFDLEVYKDENQQLNTIWNTSKT